MNISFLKGGHSAFVLLYLHFLVLWDCRNHNLFESRVALKPGQSGVRDVAFAIISREIESAVFIFWMLYFQRIPLSDILYKLQSNTKGADSIETDSKNKQYRDHSRSTTFERSIIIN